MTLIECVVYMALLTLLITSSHASVVAISNASNHIQQEALLLREGIFTHGRIRDAVWESHQVLEASTDLLLLEQDNGTPVRFQRINQELIYTINDTRLSLIAPSVKVLTFASQVITTVGEPSRLEIQLELTVSGVESSMTREFKYLFYP